MPSRRPPAFLRMDLPRQGRSFSVVDLPKARAQRLWMRYLPWQPCLAIDAVGAALLKRAMGCDEPSPESELLLSRALDRIARGELLVRVIVLCERYAVPPAAIDRLNQARLDRWLPPGWRGDAKARTLAWCKPTRFAGPLRNRELPPGCLPLALDPVDSETASELRCHRLGVASWLKCGAIVAMVNDT